VISRNDKLVYRWIISYMAKMINVWKPKQGLVLMGLKGTGKPTIAFFNGLSCWYG